MSGSLSFKYLQNDPAALDLDLVYISGLQEFSLWAVAKMGLTERHIEITFLRQHLGTSMGKHCNSIFNVDEADRFTISLDLSIIVSFTDAINSISHELIHARQWNDGKLGHCEISGFEGFFQWEGMPFPAPEDMDQYENCPWEIEAHLFSMTYVSAYQAYQFEIEEDWPNVNKS